MLKLLRPQSYDGLLTSFLILIIVSTLEQYLEREMWLLDVALVVVLVFAINAVTGDRHGVRMTLFLGLPAVVGGVLAVFWNEPPTIVIVLTFVFMLSFLVAVIVVLQRHIMTSDRVSADTLRGAVCVYVLLGIAWAVAYRFVGYLEPNAFYFAGHFVDQDRSLALNIYFSFVTLTTLGYGDISPISPIARTLAWLEAAVGQVYVAITIARLVSMYIADRSTRTGGE
jgi:voltage-gated potassium channel